ncbi:Os07g0145866 [Oryza sativa Japonica Group]|uniref:Os07g0145866 protein n=2 Tax=Oryza sativa subsp. japonica TaxID=39947 RepID=Q84YW7_ORYSJ|nr:hypothetical protein [Oryza sativa Japonica Group]BAT00049.1 Os07g0145866 [Oryza sativa Japonica Group]
MIRRPLAEKVAIYNKAVLDKQEEQKKLDEALSAPEDPRTAQLELLPLLGKNLPDLNVTVYDRRSARIRNAYNGQRVAEAVQSSSGSDKCSRTTKRVIHERSCPANQSEGTRETG